MEIAPALRRRRVRAGAASGKWARHVRGARVVFLDGEHVSASSSTSRCVRGLCSVGKCRTRAGSCCHNRRFFGRAREGLLASSGRRRQASLGRVFAVPQQCFCSCQLSPATRAMTCRSPATSRHVRHPFASHLEACPAWSPGWPSRDRLARHLHAPPSTSVGKRSALAIQFVFVPME